MARTSALEYEDFNSAKSRLLECAEKYMLLYALCVPIRYEVIAKGRPDGTRVLLSNELSKLDVPVKLLLDSAVAYSMAEVDMVFVGADGVVESGGVINMMGTYQMAVVAHSMNKPVYVAAESYKRKDGYECL
ncbi:NagB/RpiA/CoA transferase-like superfamily protein [Raphanus sativus]|nr:NagB/RpiA/CoA transferase-like superfamily protein [Raphanus sativus]